MEYISQKWHYIQKYSIILVEAVPKLQLLEMLKIQNLAKGRGGKQGKPVGFYGFSDR
jgi:hypothetical protein